MRLLVRMTNVQNILVPYAGSESANRARDLAVNIINTVGRGKSDLTLLHVIAEFPSDHFINGPLVHD